MMKITFVRKYQEKIILGGVIYTLNCKVVGGPCRGTDMEAFEAMMTSPEMKEWDKENNCVDIIYSLEKIN